VPSDEKIMLNDRLSINTEVSTTAAAISATTASVSSLLPFKNARFRFPDILPLMQFFLSQRNFYSPAAASAEKRKEPQCYYTIIFFACHEKCAFFAHRRRARVRVLPHPLLT
jgi:hypothetical protein